MKLTVIIPVYNQQDLVTEAIRSIPERNDIEIIVIDDGSTDRTWRSLFLYQKYQNHKIKLLRNDKNMGVAYTVNRGYDEAKGEYIVLLGSDDYFYKENLEKALQELDGTDMIFFQTTNNYGMVELDEHNKCGSFKFMRREFIKDLKNDENRIAGEDYYLWQKILERKPTTKELDITVKHYNYPRTGSLNWELNSGIIDLESGKRI